MERQVDVFRKAQDLLNKQFSINVRGERVVTSASELGYTFAFDNARARFGCCKYGKMQITLSKHYVKNNVGKHNDDIIDTILHEIAHAIAHHAYGYRGHHGYVWQEVARQIGARPERCGKAGIKIADKKWLLECPNCGRTSERHRLASNRSFACGSCCREYNGGKYSEDFVMKIHKKF